MQSKENRRRVRTKDPGDWKRGRRRLKYEGGEGSPTQVNDKFATFIDERIERLAQGAKMSKEQGDYPNVGSLRRNWGKSKNTTSTNRMFWGI